MSANIVYLQVNEKFFKLKRDIATGNIENAQQTSLNIIILLCIKVCACAISVLHEQWMCVGMQRHTHITLWNQYLYTDGNHLIHSYSPPP